MGHPEDERFVNSAGYGRNARLRHYALWIEGRGRPEASGSPGRDVAQQKNRPLFMTLIRYRSGLSTRPRGSIICTAS
jgi:hypothetical protein